MKNSRLSRILVLSGLAGFSIFGLPPLISNRTTITKEGVYEFRRAGPTSLEYYSLDPKDGRTRFHVFPMLFGPNEREIRDKEGDDLADEVTLSEEQDGFLKGTYDREKDFQKYRPLFEEADKTLREQRERFAEYLPKR